MEKKKSYTKRIILVLIFLLLFAIYSFISYRGEYLQILEIGEEYTEIFNTNLKYKYITSGVIFAIVFLSVYITTKIIKSGLKKFFIEEKKEFPKLPNKSIALVIGVIVSIFTADIVVNKVMLAINSTVFEIFDPVFNMDIGYYIFQKPFIELILGYAIALIIGLTIYTGLYYIIIFNKYFDGISRETLKENAFIKQILMNIFLISVIIAALTFINSQNILFQNFLTLTDEAKTELVGAGATDIAIAAWGYRILAVIIVIAIFMAIRNFRKSNTKKVLLWLASIPTYLILMFIVMVLFQAIFVSPNKLENEKEYIEYNIKNTRMAYNIDVEEEQIDYTGTITLDDIEKNTDIIYNVPIITEDVVLQTLKDYQKNSGIYTYRTAQLQKYNINKTESLVYVSPREILSNGDRIADNKLYKYTHGYGTIITSATTSTEKGEVQYIQNDIGNSEKVIDISNPRIYFGLETNETVITNVNGIKEYDYPIDSNTNAEFVYDGEAGLSLGFFDRVILGITKSNLSIPFSGKLNEESKILINRNVLERVKVLMPYLTYDDQAYLVIRDDGKLAWVIDAYTTSNSYPYSQSSTIENNGVKTKINYIRNSVKVIVDAYDGTVTFYITDRTDPIAMAYRKIYPSLFVDIDESLPKDIAEHALYPKFLYDIQANMLTGYHNVETEVLYRNDDIWEVAKSTSQKTSTVKGVTMESYYIMVKKGEKNEVGLVVPYTPYGKQNLVSYLVGTYENGNRLKVYRFAAGNSVLGPMQLNAQIEQDNEISKELELLNVPGSKIVKNIIVVPIGDTLLYVEPIYQVSSNESEIPVLKKIVVASGNKVAIGNDLKSALDNLLSQYAVSIEVSSDDEEKDLIDSIIKANTNLSESSNNNDWEMVGKDIKKLQDLINQLEEFMKVEAEKGKENEVDNNNGNSIGDALSNIFGGNDVNNIED